MLGRSNLVGRTLAGLVLSLLSAGCQGPQIVDRPLDAAPREGRTSQLPEYVAHPPDVLLVEMEPIGALGKTLQAGDQVNILIDLDSRSKSPPVEGTAVVSPDGTLVLPPIEESAKRGPALLPPIRVQGLTLVQARERILVELRKEAVAPLLQLSLPSARAIAGQYLVRPDGFIKLGFYGAVPAAGLPLSQIEAAIKQHLRRVAGLDEARVNVDVLSYNSMVYYVIADGGGVGDQVTKLPMTGRETVLDAIAELGGMPPSGSRQNIWIARPLSCNSNQAEILPVDWVAITKRGAMSTNYQLLPGDRLYIKADGLIAADTVLGKIFAPFERVFGILTLGSVTQQSLSGRLNRGGVGGAGT